MGLFFSATGNTEFIARQLALKLGDECLNLLDRVKKNDHTVIHSEKPFIICAPVYVCEMPRFLAKYLKEQTFTGSRDVYFVFTSGGYAGISGILAKGIVKKKKMNYLGHAEFKMPRNYVANDHYPMLPFDQIIGIIGEAGSGKSVLIKGMFPGLELTNDDDGVYVRPLPLLDQDDERSFFQPHTYHVDIRFENGFTQMSVLADAIAEKAATAIVYSGSDDAGYSICIISKGVDTRELGKAVNAQLNGRGGGKPGAFQGNLRATKAEIEAFFA